MSTLDAISESLDAFNQAIFLNYGFLPAISAVIYVIWTRFIHKSIRSAWYISLGIPGTIAFILFLVEFVFFWSGSNQGIFERIPLLLVTLVYMPGFIVPALVLVYHIIRFSPTERITRSVFLWAIPIVLTYIVNWIVAWYFADW